MLQYAQIEMNVLNVAPVSSFCWGLLTDVGSGLGTGAGAIDRGHTDLVGYIA